MQLEKYFEDFKTNHVNTLPVRSYYIPKDSDGNDKIIMLSGDDWKFKLFSDYIEVPDGFATGYCNKFDTITVPSCWNCIGYERHQYCNVNAPIPFDPPYVPHKNPCGAYTKFFNLSEEDLQSNLHLNFEGVDSCYYVWLNGNFVGYSQVSHSTSEFDITKFATIGENTLSVLVLKWCDGSYFEDQDKFRMSGIFRDVYILKREDNYIRDFSVMTDISDDKGIIEVKIDTIGKGTYKAEIFEGKTRIVSYNISDSCKFIIDNPKLWSAEAPYLYTLVLTGSSEVIRQIVGIKKIEIVDSVFYINKVPVKLKGTNRHESDPYTGYTISREKFLKDITLMKEHNINAVRTSHYPQAPWTMDLYSEYGFYIIDETDIETHNTCTIYGGGHDRGYQDEIRDDRNFGMLCNNPDCHDSILDRVQRCFSRDKNSPCVIMWSLGNESGYGSNMEDAAKWIKEQDQRHIVHYESSIYQLIGHKNDLTNIDVYSRMYPDTKSVYNYCHQEKVNRPYVLCEYTHAMGNSSGDLEDYFNLFYSEKNLMGGFIWEWCDHAPFQGRTPEGRIKFGYGGDFNEFPNDGNFCADGLVSSDRKTVHSSLKEHKNVARPVRCEYLGENKIRLHNMLDFVDIKDLYDIHIERYTNQEKTQYKNLTDFSIKAKGYSDYELPFDTSFDDCYILVKYIVKKDYGLLKEGFEAGFDQIIFSERKYIPSELSAETNMNVFQDNKIYIIKGETFKYAFDKYSASVVDIVNNNQTYLSTPMEYNMWRAPLDNDRKVKLIWQKAGYNRVTTKVYSSKLERTKDKITITFELSLIPVHLQRIFNVTTKFEVYRDGSLRIKSDAKKDPVFPYIPRFGIRMFMPKSFDKVSYYGYGPGESYIDKHNYCYKALFNSRISDTYEDYLMPQENGSHFDCNFCSVSSKSSAMEIYGKGFSMNASEYTQEELEKKAHNYELIQSPYTVLCLDAKMSGVGSSSCGPELIEKYQTNHTEISMDFTFNFKNII